MPPPPPANKDHADNDHADSDRGDRPPPAPRPMRPGPVQPAPRQPAWAPPTGPIVPPPPLNLPGEPSPWSAQAAPDDVRVPNDGRAPTGGHGPSGGHVPSDAYGPPTDTVLPRTNRLAVVALLSGLFGLVLFAIAFGVAAIVQAGRRGERGRGLAVGGIAASAVWSLVGVVAVAGILGSLLTADRDESGRVTGKDRVMPASLRVGDCFTGFEGKSLMNLVTTTPCARPHDGEAVDKVRLRGTEYPGDQKLLEEATLECDLKAVRFRKSRHVKNLVPYLVHPTRASWNSGDRRVLCLIRYTGAESLTVPLAQTLDPNLKLWHELKRGDCFAKWDGPSPSQRVLPCTTPHWSQIYAVYRMKPGPYQGAKVMEHDAEKGCGKRLDDVFPSRRDSILYGWVFAEKYEWESGIRTVVCFVENRDGPLKKSIVP